MDTAFERLLAAAGPPSGSRLTLHPPTAEVARALGGTPHPRHASVARELAVPLPNPFPPPGPHFDEVLLPLTNGRALARVLLTAAVRCLRPGGKVLFAADNRHGARTFESDAAALGTVENLYAGSGCRVAQLTPHPHFALPPGWHDPGTPLPLTFTLTGQSHTHFTHPGVFSADSLDDGTRFLLDHLPPLIASAPFRIFDACCGSAAIARVIADRHPAASMVAADDDALAVLCARQTLAGSPAAVVSADLTAPWPFGPFDLILCNPPFHQGGAIDRSFVARFLPHAARGLAPAGRLILIANRFLAYESQLQTHFPAVRRLAEDNRWRLWEAAKSAPRSTTATAPASPAPATAAKPRPARGSR